MESKSPKTQKRNTRRKSEIDPALYRYSFRLTSEEKIKFDGLLSKSGLDDKTKYIKSVLFGKELKVVKVDKATMDYYIRLTNFYTQFQAIGNNYNQTVKAIKTNFSEKRALALMYKLEKTTIQLIVLSKEIIQLTEDYERKWLQK